MISQHSQRTLLSNVGASVTGTVADAVMGGAYFVQVTGTLGAATFLQVQHPDGTWVNYGNALTADFMVTLPAVPVRAVTGTGASGVSVWLTRTADAPASTTAQVGAGTAAGAITTTQASDSPLVVATGSIADAAATDSTSSWSVIALLKGIVAQMLSTAPAQVYRADSYLNIVAGTATTTVKSGAGTLSGISINTKGASANVITVYDNTAASGTLIATIDGTSDRDHVFDVAFATGLTVKSTTGTGADMTIRYR